MDRSLNYSDEVNLVNSLLTKKNDNCHCGMCISVLFDRYVQVFFSKNQLNELRKQNNVYKKQLGFRDLDLINKGKVLERIINEVKTIDPFDKVNPWMLAAIASYLESFFSKTYLKKEFKETYLDSILLSLKIKKQQRKKEILQKEERQKKIHKLEKAEKEFQKNLKEKNKIARDIRRTKFLFIFNQLNPIKKLRVILNGLDIPLEAIPDDSLFEPCLKLRFMVHREFSKEELSKLIEIFGGNMKKNKRKTWKKILKVLK